VGSACPGSVSSLLTRLRALPLFAGLDEDELQTLSAATSELEAPAGQMLIERGRPGSGLFILETGQAVVEAPEGQRELGPGDVFGERALLGDDVQRTARVRASTNVRCLAISRDAIEDLIRRRPEVAQRLSS
jgi:CRP/FNR family transcriptional regulator, cyclic AMP receptor protein